MVDAVKDELAAIEATVVSYLAAFNRDDVNAVLATYADDGVLMGPGNPAAVGKSTLAQAYPGIFEAASFDIDYEIKEAVQTGAEWGFVRTATEGTVTNKASGIAAHATFHELFLLRKSAEGAWQIARYSTSKIS